MRKAGAQDDRRSDRLALAGTVAGLVAALVLISLSDGFHHDDDIEHYSMAVDAWGSHDALLHWWARPGYNLPAMFAARLFGLPGCRILSALLTAGVAWLAYGIAKVLTRDAPGLRRLAFTAPLLVWAQPLAMTLAETTLTETPAAFYLTLGVWLGLLGRRAWAAAALSLLFVTRLETMALAPFFALWFAVAARREGGRFVVSCLLLGWAPLAWVIASWLLQVSPEVSPLHAFTKEPAGGYGSGSWLHFLVRFLLSSGLGAALLFAAGVARLGRSGLPAWGPVLALLLLHTVLYRFNRVDSGGYARFLVPAAGLVAAVAAAGLGALLEEWGRRYRVARWLAFVAAALVLLQVIALVRPLTFSHPAADAPEATGSLLGRDAALLLVRPLSHTGMRYGRATDAVVREVGPIGQDGDPAVWRTHVFYRHLVPGSRRIDNPAHGVRVWAAAPPGTLLFWENKYGGPEGGEFHEALRRGGRVLASRRCGYALAEVFERTPN